MRHLPGIADQIFPVFTLRHGMEIFIWWCPGCPWLSAPTWCSPDEATNGNDGGGAWRSKGRWGSVRDLGKGVRARLSPLWASGLRAWGWGSNWGGSWATSALMTGPPPARLLRISWTWRDSGSERFAPSWCRDWDRLPMCNYSQD